MKRILLTFGVFVSLLLGITSPASAQTCTDVSGVGRVCTVLAGDKVVVTVLGVEVARVDAPVVHSTVRVQVPGPIRTIPGPTTTVPGPTRTIPGPIRTIYITRDGKTITVSPTIPSGQTTYPRDRVSITPSPMPSPVYKTVAKEREITISIPKAVGFSVGLILAGVLLALAALWLIYIVGYREGSEGDKKFLRDFLNDLRRRT
jgi:hypothetical protein